jgi:hypothetical protein
LAPSGADIIGSFESTRFNSSRGELMKRTIFMVVLAVVMTGCSESGMLEPDSGTSGRSEALSAAADRQGKQPTEMANFEVTIVNMSHAQPLSPGVLVTHDSRARLFQTGSAASEGIRLIAENGDPTTAIGELGSAQGVAAVISTGAPVHRRGGPGENSLTMQISSEPDASYLSMALMMICTNDGFVGLDSVLLPDGPETAVYFATPYDAGTEYNDELSSSIVDPCGAIGPVEFPGDGLNDRTATTDTVELHPGIAGSGDLDDVAHQWRNKVAQVKIRRLR